MIRFTNSGGNGPRYSNMTITSYSDGGLVVKISGQDDNSPNVVLDRQQAEHLRDQLIARFPVVPAPSPAEVYGVL
jgi:hypothetical protein